MATREGIVDGYDIDSSVEEHIFKKIEIHHPGDKITDHLNQRIAYIYYAYSDRDEMIDTVSRINDLIHIDFRE